MYGASSNAYVIFAKQLITWPIFHFNSYTNTMHKVQFVEIFTKYERQMKRVIWKTIFILVFFVQLYDSRTVCFR